MKFMFVVGGSYKSFYLNQIKNIKKIDLLVFHQNIFYDFDYVQEKFFDAPVSKELISLNQIVKCPIVVYGNFVKENKIKKCFILCVHGKVSIIDCVKDIYLYIKGKFILIGNRLYNYSRAFATISIVDEKYNFQKIGKTYQKNYFICDTRGVSRIKNGKIYRKFRKCGYFSLSFYKKDDIMKSG